MRPLEYRKKILCCSGKGLLKNPDAEIQQESFVAALGAGSLAAFAENLGVCRESLQRLGLGFDRYAYTFPMRDADGQICGFRKRPYKDVGQKHSAEGSALGLFIPEGVRPGNVEMICEGESDTPAALTLETQAIGIPGACNCLAEAVAFVGRSPVACPCIMGDADPNGTGTRGAEKLASALHDAGIPCRVLFPPEGCKDLREWLLTGLTPDGLRQAVKTQPIRYPGVLQYPPGFTMLPNALLRQGVVKKIGGGPFALACLIQSFYRPGIAPFPEREQLADLLKVSECTVDRYKAILEQAGILTWKRGHTGRANEYRVNLGPVRKKK